MTSSREWIFLPIKIASAGGLGNDPALFLTTGAARRAAKAQAVRREGRGRAVWQAAIEAAASQAETAAMVRRAATEAGELRVETEAAGSRAVILAAVRPEEIPGTAQ
jgi:hypothetical protein